jgi:maltose O-acetyltransferase
MNLRSAWSDARAVLRARFYLRHATVLGKRVRVWGRPAIGVWGRLVVGDRVMLISTPVRTELSVGGTLEIGERTFINYGCSIGASELVRIGPRCSLGTHAILMDNDFHTIDPERRQQRPASQPIVLEENVWLGARVIVLKGVTIGADSVIGAGSVVTRDIPPRSVAVGAPARVVRSL